MTDSEDWKEQRLVTVKDLDSICEQIVKLEQEKEAIEETLMAKNKEIMTMYGRATAFLAETGRDEYETPIGKLKIERKWRVNLPEEGEPRTALFNHLRERGIADAYLTIHSGRFNALYMADWAAAKDQGLGMEFTMPGVQAPTLFETTKFKLSKKAKK
jgi:hypothetical protein